MQIVGDHLDSYASLTAAVRDIAGKLGCSPDSLRVWYKQAQRDAGKEAGPSSAEKARIEELERENRELRQARMTGVVVFEPARISNASIGEVERGTCR